MNWISLLLQLLALRKTAHHSSAMLDAAKNMAERGKRTFVSVMVLVMSGLFFFSALLVAVIDLGLQIDRDGALSYSGLMISATILLVIGLLLVVVSMLVNRASAPPPPPPPRSSEREEKIKELLENFLIGFLTKMTAKKAPPPAQE